MITVIMPDGKIKECKRHKVKDVLKKLGLNENAVLVAKDDMLLTPDIQLSNGEVFDKTYGLVGHIQ